MNSGSRQPSFAEATEDEKNRKKEVLRTEKRSGE